MAHPRGIAKSTKCKSVTKAFGSISEILFQQLKENFLGAVNCCLREPLIPRPWSTFGDGKSTKRTAGNFRRFQRFVVNSHLQLGRKTARLFEITGQNSDLAFQLHCCRRLAVFVLRFALLQGLPRNRKRKFRSCASWLAFFIS